MRVSSSTIVIKKLGRQPYSETVCRMKAFTADRTLNTLDQFWLLEHPSIYTLGQAAKEKHVLDPKNIEVVRCDRGGQVTYHGPGQIVGYLMIDLRRKSISIEQLVTGIETAIVAALHSVGVDSHSEERAHGVYVNDKKIAALGFRVSKGRTYHGFSLNVNMDLEPFTRINPCGYRGLKVTDIFSERGHTVIERLHCCLVREVTRAFHYSSFEIEKLAI